MRVSSNRWIESRNITVHFDVRRCGGSANKPLCDGTHAAIGFKAGQELFTLIRDGGTNTAMSMDGARGSTGFGQKNQHLR